MTGTIKKRFTMFFLSLFTATALLGSFAEPVRAENSEVNRKSLTQKKVELILDSEASEETVAVDAANMADESDEGTGVHADPETFKKNFRLSPEQKEYTIQECEKVVSQIIKPGMSDLEKYYTLAVWANKHVVYDWQFWSGRYFFEYYSHQWDAYGAMKEDEKSVCVGIAIFYSNLCHAADLPCKFVRVQPQMLDHTIDYIPDINGNAYYMDVTENLFFMSERSNPFEPIDKVFSKITQDCNANTFDFQGYEEGMWNAPEIKECYDKPFAKWFEEYALHKNTTKKFDTDYVEKGSGDGTHHASYTSYPSNFTENPDVWFLDDFYENPSEIKDKVLHNTFDEQLLSVSGISKNYECDKEDLIAAVKQDLEQDSSYVKYFPTGTGGEITAESANLTEGVDYEISCEEGAEPNMMNVILTGRGEYNGKYTIPVTVKTAYVEKEPAVKKNLVYDGTPKELIEPGEAFGGEIEYALGTRTAPEGEFTEKIPTATDAGKYYVWYQVVGDDTHVSAQQTYIGKVAEIDPRDVNIIAENVTVSVGKTAVISPETDIKKPVMFYFYTIDEDIATVDQNGTVTGLKEGRTMLAVSGFLKYASQNYRTGEPKWVIVDVVEDAVDIDRAEVVLSNTAFTYNGTVQKPSIKIIKGQELKEGTDYTAVWSNESSQDAGTYTVTIIGKGKYTGTAKATYTINKAANPMTLKAKTVKIKYSKLKKKAQSIKRAKGFSVSRAEGKVAYKLVSAKKGKKSFKKKFRINAETGKITVKKNLKKGTYKVKVKVKAGGNTNFEASAWKKITIKIKIK